MSKITKTFEDKSYSMSTGFTKDLNLFKVNATVWSYVGLDDHEINDIELSYEINGKYCRYAGFKGIYEKLYGNDTFKKFESDMAKEFEEAYYADTPYKLKTK
jgi:hypothetical protein